MIVANRGAKMASVYVVPWTSRIFYSLFIS